MPCQHRGRRPSSVVSKRLTSVTVRAHRDWRVKPACRSQSITHGSMDSAGVTPSFSHRSRTSCILRLFSARRCFAFDLLFVALSCLPALPYGMRANARRETRSSRSSRESGRCLDLYRHGVKRHGVGLSIQRVPLALLPQLVKDERACRHVPRSPNKARFSCTYSIQYIDEDAIFTIIETDVSFTRVELTTYLGHFHKAHNVTLTVVRSR